MTTLVCSVCCLRAATVFEGPGLDIGDSGNWDNGLPTLTNEGTIGGTYITTYGGGDLNDVQLIIEMQAELTGGTANITDSSIFLRGSALWENSNTVTLGRASGSEPSTSVTIEDTAQWNVTSGNLRIGRQQRATVSQLGGTVNVQNNVDMGISDAGGLSSYDLSGGQLIGGRDLIVRRASTFSLSGTGNADLTRNLQIRDSGSSAQISGGDLSVGQNFILRDNGSFATQSGGDVVVGNNLNLNRSGGSRQYNLQGGTLRVRNRINVSSNNVFVWETGGVLAVHTESNLIDYRGDLTAGSGSILNLASSVQYLSVSGTLVVNGLEIKGYDLMLSSLANPDGETVETGYYVLVQAGNLNVVNVSFSDFFGNAGTLINDGDPFDPLVQNVYWYREIDNEIRVYWSVAPVPEPSSSAFLAFGLALLLSFRRRV